MHFNQVWCQICRLNGAPCRRAGAKVVQGSPQNVSRPKKKNKKKSERRDAWDAPHAAYAQFGRRNEREEEREREQASL